MAEDALGALRRVRLGELVSGNGHRDTRELHVEPCWRLLGQPNSGVVLSMLTSITVVPAGTMAVLATMALAVAVAQVAQCFVFEDGLISP